MEILDLILCIVKQRNLTIKIMIQKFHLLGRRFLQCFIEALNLMLLSTYQTKIVSFSFYKYVSIKINKITLEVLDNFFELCNFKLHSIAIMALAFTDGLRY